MISAGRAFSSLTPTKFRSRKGTFGYRRAPFLRRRPGGKRCAGPGWITHAWLGMATYDAGKRDFRSAYELTQRFGEAVALPRITSTSSLEELQKRFYTAPDNYAVGYALYREQMRRGRIDDALLTAR